MQLYLWPPNVPSLLSGENRLSSMQPVHARERAKYSGVNFNIYCTWAPVSPADKASSQTLSLSNPVFSHFPCRTKRRRTTRATSTPASSKPWRPRRTGSDEPAKPRPRGGRGTETEIAIGNEIGNGTRRPRPRRLSLHSWIQTWWREQVC